MKRLTMTLATFIALALPLAAQAAQKDALFTNYEQTRQALLKQSLPEVKAAAAKITIAATTAKQPKIAAAATTLSKAATLPAARTAFAALSDEMIRYRAAATGEKPTVAYCPMEKKSWLQPAGEISNPYLDAGMRKCGEVKEK